MRVRASRVGPTHISSPMAPSLSLLVSSKQAAISPALQGLRASFGSPAFCDHRYARPNRPSVHMLTRLVVLPFFARGPRMQASGRVLCCVCTPPHTPAWRIQGFSFRRRHALHLNATEPPRYPPKHGSRCARERRWGSCTYKDGRRPTKKTTLKCRSLVGLHSFSYVCRRRVTFVDAGWWRTHASALSHQREGEREYPVRPLCAFCGPRLRMVMQCIL